MTKYDLPEYQVKEKLGEQYHIAVSVDKNYVK